MMLLELFWTFFKIGAFTFGGGYAMLPLIQSEVTSKGWIDEASLVNFIAVSESTPGPIAVNMATYVGSELGGVPGALCATLGVVLPSFIIILLVAKCFERFRQSRAIQGAMSGLKPAVVGLIATAMVSVGKTVFFSAGLSLAVLATPMFYVCLGIFGVMLLLAFKKVHPIAIIGMSAAIGILAGYLFA